MYPSALHKMPTQTVDSSQVFERRILQKAAKDDQQNDNKIATQTQSAILNKFVPNKPKISSLDCCGQRHFYLD